MKPLIVVALSGSLRAGSSNTLLLQAAAQLAPPGMDVALYAGIRDLPHFDPDLGDGAAPVARFRRALQAAGGALISCPEYAHGIPGSFKNALDWIVGTGELVGKPVALFNASPRGVHAQAQLREVLTVMMAEIVDAAAVTWPADAGAIRSIAQITSSATFSSQVTEALRRFAAAIDTRPASGV